MGGWKELLPWVCLSGLCIGLSKGGFGAASLISVAVMAEMFGRLSLGIILPMLVIADLLVYPSLRKHGSWREVWPLLGPALAGIPLGYAFLHYADEKQARQVIGVVILAMIGVKMATDLARKKGWNGAGGVGFSSACGVAAGFSTMTANAAGPITTLYLLERRVPKAEFLGLSARFYLFINLFKIPFSLKLGLFTAPTLLWNLCAAPVIAAGAFGGLWLIRRVPQRPFELMMLAFAVAVAVRLIWF